MRQICSPYDAQSAWGEGRVPDTLVRPMRHPALAPGAPCPVSARRRVPAGAGFGPWSYDAGDEVGLGAAPPPGQPSEPGAVGGDGWWGIKALWFAYPSYDGPFLVRGMRLDGVGPVAFGEQPVSARLVVPPGPTINMINGYRQAPGGVYVKAAGCYALQVDGLTFSRTIVVDIGPAADGTRAFKPIRGGSASVMLGEAAGCVQGIRASPGGAT